MEPGDGVAVKAAPTLGPMWLRFNDFVINWGSAVEEARTAAQTAASVHSIRSTGMKTLLLLRHGKSSWDDPDLNDHERPLAPRGIRAATEMGQYLKSLNLGLDLILCSSARRAVETLELVRGVIGTEVAVERERGLYLCGRITLLERLRDLPAGVDTAMLVGHNPDLHELALLLTGTGETLALQKLREKFPTAACATLQFGVTRWPDIAPGGASLVQLQLPRSSKKAKETGNGAKAGKEKDKHRDRPRKGK